MRDVAGLDRWAGLGHWIERKMRAHRTAAVLARLDRHLMDDIGVCPATLDEAAEIAARATERKPWFVQGLRGQRT